MPRPLSQTPGEEIAALYKRRWQIELPLGQTETLKIRHFLGRSENAMRIQLAVALVEPSAHPMLIGEPWWG
jgi:IS4 transposase